jgi:hypothetical protein
VTRIFLSYRRDDSAGQAGRLFDRLSVEFGQDSLFMDVDNIPLGTDFATLISEEVSKCDVLLAVIGPRWLESLGDDGERRIDNPNDFVRTEICAALQREIPIIPILVDGAKIPPANLLPEVLTRLSRRHGLEVRNTSFHGDLQRLVDELKRPKYDTPDPVIDLSNNPDPVIKLTSSGDVKLTWYNTPLMLFPHFRDALTPWFISTVLGFGAGWGAFLGIAIALDNSPPSNQWYVIAAFTVALLVLLVLNWVIWLRKQSWEVLLAASGFVGMLLGTVSAIAIQVSKLPILGISVTSRMFLPVFLLIAMLVNAALSALTLGLLNHFSPISREIRRRQRQKS